MLPAHQRLQALHALAARRDQRLVGDRQLVPGDRRAQVVLDRLAEVQLLLHRLVEEGEAVAALVLGPVQGEIGRLGQRLGGRSILRAKRHAEGDGDEHLRRAEIEGRDHRVVDAMRHGSALHGILDVEEHQGELVAAEAGEAVALTDHAADALGDAGDQPVARAMAGAVVDALEMVDVDGDERERRLRAALRHGVVEHLLEEQAVRQVRQRIDAGLVDHLGLARLQLRDVEPRLPQEYREQEARQREDDQQHLHRRIGRAHQLRLEAQAKQRQGGKQGARDESRLREP